MEKYIAPVNFKKKWKTNISSKHILSPLWKIEFWKIKTGKRNHCGDVDDMPYRRSISGASLLVGCISIYTEQRIITSSQACSLLTQIELHRSIQFPKHGADQSKDSCLCLVSATARQNKAPGSYTFQLVALLSPFEVLIRMIDGM
jgi:hypothetical protein